MIGYEISFLDREGEYVEVTGPFFSPTEALKTAIAWLEEDMMNKIELCQNEYLGTENDYDFNDCFWRRIYNLENFLDSFIN